MIIFIHKDGRWVRKVLKGEEEIFLKVKNVVDAFWEVAERFPSEIIFWVEEGQKHNVNMDNIQDVFHHDLIMASYAVKNSFFDHKLGYIDQSPFININRNVVYPTWLMSSDIGGIKGGVLLKFKHLFAKIRNFDYLLNAIGKIGQQNGLFCYSAPILVRETGNNLKFRASKKQLFSFVFNFYKKFRAIVLLWCMYRYEREFPFRVFFRGIFRKSYFNKEINFKGIKIVSSRENPGDKSIDVIIPTIGRPAHCLNVLEDLRHQTHLPKKVIIVEQNPDEDSQSDLDKIYSQEWPFQIKHIFTHKPGACRARNRALDHVESAWVFLCDDDNRFKPDLIQKSIVIAKEYGVEALNTAYLTPGEKSHYKTPKQWGTFGSGNAIVRMENLRQVRFDTVFEYGYAEDMDFGMQLRNLGVDILYHPNIEITHLKAPVGGFRTILEKPWERTAVLPKPSPTVMLYAHKHYTRPQLLGYKNILWLKFYRAQEIKHPYRYISSMRSRWRKSEKWAAKLISIKSTGNGN